MIQININKPTSCDDCPLCVDFDCIIHDHVTHEYYDSLQEQFWHCPIVESQEVIETVYYTNEPEQKHGRWIKFSPAGIYECSVCHQDVMTQDIDAYEFCHHCGARMDGES